MKAWIGVGLAAAAALGPVAAVADDTSGYPGFALAAIVGSYSPTVSAADKAILAGEFVDPTRYATAAKFIVTATDIKCSASDVIISGFACDLKFSAATRHLEGRAANELYATLAQAGVQDDGAAGTMYHEMTNLRCEVDPSNFNSGGGVSCTYAQPNGNG